MRSLSDDDTLDFISEPTRLVERLPHYAERFTAVQEMQKAMEEAAVPGLLGRGLGGRGAMKRVANIPAPVLEAMLELDPSFLANKKKFFAWLDRNPAYQIYRRRRGGHQ